MSSLKKRVTSGVIFAIALPILSACASKSVPDTHFYLLDPAPQKLSNNYRDQLIEVSKISLPKYLKNNQLMMLGAHNKLIPANYHKWADEFGPSIRRALIVHLEVASDTTSYTDACDQCDALNLTIEHFYPTEDGRLIFSGNYELETIDGIAVRKRFAYEETLPQGGYAQAVKQMNTLLEKLALEITATLA
jgi:hypothetical protein